MDYENMDYKEPVERIESASQNNKTPKLQKKKRKIIKSSSKEKKPKK
ncbi:MAG: hypothetical protein GX786_08015, partial [Clostridiales bacterium]|nr:hypothetical protein [Clostridiales bacterium]